MLIYHEPEPLSKEKAATVFGSANKSEICDTLVAVAFYEEDWRWVQERCLEFLTHEEPDIRGLAATCLAHVARFRQKLDKCRVLMALHSLLKDADADVVASAKDSLREIVWLLPGKRNRRPKVR